MGLHTSTPEGQLTTGSKSTHSSLSVLLVLLRGSRGRRLRLHTRADYRQAVRLSGGQTKSIGGRRRLRLLPCRCCGILMRLSATKMDSISSAKSALITLLLLVPQCSAASIVHSKAAVASCGQWRWNPGPSMKYGELAYKTRHTFQLLNFLYLNPADFERHLAAAYLIRTLAISIFVVCTTYICTITGLLKSFDDLGS